jgi:hypothetical protein
MKKGEIQITVVATGFDEDRIPLEEPFKELSRMTIEERRKPEIQVREKEEESPVSFQVKTEPKMIIEEKIPPKPQRVSSFSKREKELPDEDEELEIPAFIRRKMGK